MRQCRRHAALCVNRPEGKWHSLQGLNSVARDGRVQARKRIETLGEHRTAVKPVRKTVVHLNDWIYAEVMVVTLNNKPNDLVSAILHKR